ncbi:MAG: hypothetical protein AB1758_32595, partial [Candidatus Eremiobacterota bacterium]
VLIAAGRGGLGLLVGLLLLWQLLGSLPGTVAYLGEALAALSERPTSLARSTAQGTVLLGGVALLPWVGWVVAGAALAASIGSGILASFRGFRASRTSAPGHD